ncbi:PREDICTED: xyloglucan endotransglucosylase/hydrolase protein 31 [Brassica oleracea var. oleracea]|uniref:Xyloglucan endotransglucosylase/hydrolase n=1 Tax=Brassica oleracea var. oleracea TaxID=109376 RepID=A0A0D3BGP9_BRAOL|nr:PREDICTED: xyloglucan endotransglucosylase/hydrolase protein 31 [Brassica oleracea var. oleracea]
MAFPLILLAFLVLCSSGYSQRSPSPGYYPSSRVPTSPFDRQFRTLWGSQHQRTEQDVITLLLDKSSGSGFKSLRSYKSGYFGASIKLQSGYTAGVDTSLYLSNNQEHPGDHDEVDIEFLGTTPGKPYSLQTNVFVRGSGDRNVIGREMKFNLWFDPTQDFHHYAILWNPNQIVFYVDDVPIRTYDRKNEAIFPTRPMWLYGSIWDASDWATENGRIKADYRYQPFFAKYTNFKLAGCTTEGSSSCTPPSASPMGNRGLSQQQMGAMAWAQRNFLVYNYCHDPKRDHTQTPEC